MPCDRVCGGGRQQRKVWCWRDSGEVVEDSLCTAEKPELARACNLHMCVWHADEWSECSVPCGIGEQYREVLCYSMGTVVPVAFCDLAKPNRTRGCLEQECRLEATALGVLRCLTAEGSVVHPELCDTQASLSHLQPGSNEHGVAYLKFAGDISNIDIVSFPDALISWVAATLELARSEITARVLAGSFIVAIQIYVPGWTDNERLAKALIQKALATDLKIDGFALLAAGLTTCFEHIDRCGQCGGTGSECAQYTNHLRSDSAHVYYDGSTQWSKEEGFFRPAYLNDGDVDNIMQTFRTTDPHGILLFDLGADVILSEVQIMFFSV